MRERVAAILSVSCIHVFSALPSLSAGLSSPDPAELAQPGRPVRPEAAAAGGRAGGGAARGPGGLSAGGRAEGRVREAEGGDETAAERPEGAGQCRFDLRLFLRRDNFSDVKEDKGEATNSN